MTYSRVFKSDEIPVVRNCNKTSLGFVFLNPRFSRHVTEEIYKGHSPSLRMQVFNITIFWNFSSFNRCENCERFCFSCNFRSFASYFQRSSSVIIFGQGHLPTPTPHPPIPKEFTRLTFLSSAFRTGL